MRKFSSYGPIDKDSNYYVPRTELIDFAVSQLSGENPQKGGHYITVWAPRQRGKSWIMLQVRRILQQNGHFDVLKINLEHLKMSKSVDAIVQNIGAEIIESLQLEIAPVQNPEQFYQLFKQGVLKKPLILILDEFDALLEEAISGMAGVFRNIYNQRQGELDQPTERKSYLLHSVALIGVRSVLGVENVTGSPFNVQRSLHIPNLTAAEVQEMFAWYERESGQQVEPEVVKRLFYELQGQPGLTSWLGELLTETYNQDNQQPIALNHFKRVFARATQILPNNNILNIISKAKQKPYKDKILELFRTDEKTAFKYDDWQTNFLYMNGIIDIEESGDNFYIKFPCPFVQKRLFNYFAGELIQDMGKLYGPFEDLTDTITKEQLNVKNLLRRYEQYLSENRDRLLKNAPRRTTDLRIYEAVYHFSLYMYLQHFLSDHEGQVYPEFPTGNGQVDLLIKYRGQSYTLEVKSFSHQSAYKKSLKQAAGYGRQLQVSQVWLALFVEAVDDANRQKYEVIYKDKETGVTVTPVFVETGG